MDWLGYLSLAAGVSAAITLFIQLYKAQRVRQSELIASLSERWNSSPLEKSKELADSLGRDELPKAIRDAYEAASPDWYVLMRIPSFFNTVGAMVERGDLSEKLVLYLFGMELRHYWNLYKNALTAEQLEGIPGFQMLGQRVIK